MPQADRKAHRVRVGFWVEVQSRSVLEKTNRGSFVDRTDYKLDLLMMLLAMGHLLKAVSATGRIQEMMALFR
jgi:hypothetical protein